MSVTEYLFKQAIEKGYRLIKKGNKLGLKKMTLKELLKQNKTFTIKFEDIKVKELDYIANEYCLDTDFEKKEITVYMGNINYSKIFNV